ncbi:MAG: hypothetical protein AAF842_05950 [Planctomycetota bacterium]
MNHFNSLETLENRKLLSAVTQIDGETLRVTGTERSDYVTVHQDGRDVTVTTFTWGLGFDRLVFDRFDFEKFSAETHGGSDVVRVNGLIAPDGGSVLTGRGHDKVVFSNTNISDDFTIDMGKGRDTLLMVDAKFQGLNVNMGSGSDSVFAYGSTATEYGTVLLGSGNDLLVAIDNTVFGFTTVKGESGFDVLVARGNELAGTNVETMEWVI